MRYSGLFSYRELIIILLTFMSILYATSFHYSNSSPNDTFEPGQFFVETSAEDGGDPIVSKYFSDYSLFYKKFFKNGKWTENFHPRIMTGWNDMWKSTAMSKDNAYYIIYAGYYAGLIDKIDYSVENSNASMSVHKYRVLLPMIVGNILKVSKISKKSKYEWSEKNISRIVYIYIVLNFIFLLTTAFVFMFFLINVFSFNKILSFLGSILFITLPIVTKSAGFPQAEPISLLITIFIFISVYYKKIIFFIIFSSLGLLTKDLFVYTSVLWFFNYSFLEIKNFKKIFFHFLVSIVPILIFIIIRIYYSDGTTLVETRGSYDIFKGELPPWKVTGNPYYYLEKYFLVFTFLWIGIINLNQNIFLKKSLITLLFLTFISLWIARGSGIERHVGMMFPIIIPLFLFFFKSKNFN